MRHITPSLLAIVFGLAGTSAALAADPAPPPAAPAPPSAWGWDFAFGGKALTDYNFRGISQSDRRPSWNAYGELRYGWLYAGASGYGLDLPTRPDAEVDLTAGIRPVWGPVTFDFGVTYYYYPNEQQVFVGGAPFTPRDTDFWEPYAKISYTWNDTVTVGANVFHAWDYLSTGASATYVSGTLKLALPYDFAVSGELGHYSLGRTDPILGAAQLPDYTYWNLGVSYTYKNTLTLDVRYHDTTLSRTECFAVSGDLRGLTNGGRSRWCSEALIATLSFDTSVASWLK